MPTQNAITECYNLQNNREIKIFLDRRKKGSSEPTDLHRKKKNNM